MRVSILVSIILAACVSVATGQSSNNQVDRVIYLTSIEKSQEIGEVATVIRSITEIRDLSVDASQRSLAVHGTGEQIRVAESLAKELMAGHSSDAYEYKMSSGDLVRVYYLSHSESIRDFQWVVTTIRQIAALRWAFTYNARRAFVVRGTPSQMEMSEWLAQQLDQPDGSVGSKEYPVRGDDENRDRGDDELVHVDFVKNVERTENLE